MVGFECITRLEDVQSVERAIHLKQRDSLMKAAVLVLKDSAHNRAALRLAPTLTAAFPMSSRAVFAALRDGRQPRGNGLIFL